MSDSYHYPPDILNLLVDTIPLLCRSKNDVLLFLRGAGIPDSNFADLQRRVDMDRENISKYEIVRTVLQRINERGDSYLRYRREVVKRVIEFEDYSSCWPNDQLKAKGFVAEIRRVVNVKDSFTKMAQERNKERDERTRVAAEKRENAKAQQQKIEQVKNDFYALFTMENNPQKRGSQLEKVLNNLFAAFNILVKKDFKRSSSDGSGVIEQVDGVIQLDAYLYLVEMKWVSNPIGVGLISQDLVRLFGRADVRGLFITSDSYADTAISQCREALSQKVIALCTLREIVALLERRGNLVEMLRQKIRAAELDKQPFLEILEW